jgi:Uma2 family endonuclease
LSVAHHLNTLLLMEPVHEPYERRRFTADEVWRMVEAGVLRADERVELIDGELVMVPPQGPEHASLTIELQRALQSAYGDDFHVRAHSPVIGTDDSIPEPDVAVVRGPPRNFRQRHPGPSEVVLVAEVSSSSLHADRKKASTYARAGYGTYWLVDVDNRRVEVRTLPRGDVYTRAEVIDVKAPLALPASTKTLALADLLGAS